MPKISVIVPVYNVEKYINRCVDSILSQTFADFELILVNDGSVDNCGAICELYAEQDARIRVIHQKNGGLSAARNTGIDWVFSNSDSEWITFIDSDDWVNKIYLEELLKNAKKYNQLVSICGYCRIEENYEINFSYVDGAVYDTEEFFCLHGHEGSRGWAENKTFGDNVIQACGKLYWKELFRDVRYPVGRICEDVFTIHRVLFKNKQIVFIKMPLYMYYVNPKSITGTTWNPKHLDEQKGVLEQIDFFSRNGYQAALSKRINDYCKGMIYTLIKLKKSKTYTIVRIIESIRLMSFTIKYKIAIYNREEVYATIIPCWRYLKHINKLHFRRKK